MAVDSVLSLSNGHAGNTVPDDDAASESFICTADKDILANSSTNAGSVTQAFCDRVPSQPDNCEKSRPDPAYVAAVGSGQLTEDSEDCGLLHGQDCQAEEDSTLKDSHPVNLCRLGSALWPKRTFVADNDFEHSFAALAANHANYCRENAIENSAKWKPLLSSADQTGADCAHSEAVGACVSRWLRDSNRVFSEQMPECYALCHGIPMSSQKRLALSPKPTATAIGENTLSPTSCSSETASFSGTTNSAAEFERSDLPVMLNREKILSLQFSGVQLSPEVTSRIMELRLNRTGGKLQPLRGDKQMAGGPPPYKHAETNFSSVTVAKSASPVLQPSDSTTTEVAGDEQLMNQGDVRKVGGMITAADGKATICRLPDPCKGSISNCGLTLGNMEKLSSNLRVVDGDRTDGIMSSLGNNTSHSADLQSSSASQLPCRSQVLATANTSTINKKPIRELHSTVAAAHEDPLMTATAGAMPLSGCAASPSVAADFSDSAGSKSTEKCHISSSFGVSKRLPATTSGTQVTGLSEALTDRGYHKGLASSPTQRHISQAKHPVAGRTYNQEPDDGRFAAERSHKSRSYSRRNEASAMSPVAGNEEICSRSKSQCSRCRNFDRNAKSKATDGPSRRHRRAAASELFDCYSQYWPYHMPNMTPSVLASVSYSSYCLGAFEAHMQSMRYYSMLSSQHTADMWQQQMDYISQMAKFYAHT